MRIVFSRKGFDSASGGCPSPIFEDGTMVSLPIPDRSSPVTYGELSSAGRNLGELVETLTRGKYQARHGAHLDPDLRAEACARPDGWRPAFGQCSSSQSHLRNRGVEAGDLFLFFGLFRELDSELRWKGQSRHVIWGWLQIESIGSVDDEVRPGVESGEWAWAARHPHLSPVKRRDNTLYVGARTLAVPRTTKHPGAGVFDRFRPELQLTAMGSANVTDWSLPGWFYPDGGPGLSYHEDLGRWRRDGDRARLRTVGRGQEFVIDVSSRPGALAWVRDLINP